MKFATKPIRHDPPHLRHVATLPREIKNSNFLQVFSRYGRKCKQVAFQVTNFNPSMHITVFWVYLCVFIKILSLSPNIMSIVDKHCSDVCCDEFPVAQIDRNVKQVKDQWHEKFCLQSVRKTICYCKHQKYQNSWIINKVRGDKNAICSHFLTHLLNTCSKFEFLISQGSEATCLRWDG